jgi:hypothetical protein
MSWRSWNDKPDAASIVPSTEDTQKTETYLCMPRCKYLVNVSRTVEYSIEKHEIKYFIVIL